MLTNISPYLRTSRSFPENLHHISIEMNKAYIDIANCVNQRTLGIFSSAKQITNGETWYYDQNGRHQGLRQIYTFTTLANIPHGIDLSEVNMFARGFGSYTGGTNWYGLIFGYTVPIAGQISFYVTPNNIVFVPGAGSLAPSATFKGIVVLEWLSNV